MKRPRWRAIALLAALAGLAIFLRVGWSMAQERIAQWMDAEHENAGWRWRVFGGKREGWRLFQADSVKAWNSTITLRIRLVNLRWASSENAYAIPVSAELTARRLDVAYRSSDSKDTSAPAFPGSLQIPLELTVKLDSFLLGPSQGRDSGKTILVAQGIEATTLSPRALELSLTRLDPRGIPLRAGARAAADWTDSDTLRVRLSGLVSTGCCEQDSLQAEASLTKNDLRKGRIHLSTEIEDSRGWAELLPALAKAPAVRQVHLQADARLSSGHPELHAIAEFVGDSVSFLPSMRYRLETTLDSLEGSLRLETFLDGKRTIDANLSAPVPRKGPLWKSAAEGDIRIDGLGWTLRNFEHPLDGTIDIDRIDRIGARVHYATDAGSVVDATVAWKGLHWSLDARTSPTEPWAVGWVDGLSMGGEATAHGSDSAGGASFHVTARQPRMKVVSLDSLSTGLWIGPGPHLVFGGIQAHDSGRVWIGSGDISIPDSLVRYDLHPSTDSVATARLEARFDGRVRISAASFPTKGLPLRLPFALPFDGILDGGLLHEPPLEGKPVSWVTASLRAKPRTDSLVAQIELAIRDSSIALPRIGVRIGSSTIEGSLAASVSDKGWGMDTLRLGTEKLDLSALAGLWPGIPSLKGRLRGHFLSQRNQGVSASARLESPEIVGADSKSIPLPDLLLWGERDTINLGGWIPLAGTKSPFQLTATHLWDPTPEFKLRTFWGDIVKLEAEGSFKEKKDLATTFRILGGTQIPGSDAHLNDILLSGGFQGHVGEKGFDWKAQAHGTRGVLAALERNPMDLRFEANANPKEIRLDTFSLSGAKNGRFGGSGRWDLAKQSLSMIGQAHKFRLDLGTDKSLFLDSLGVRATPDSRIRLSARDVSWHQTFPGKDEKLDVGIARTNLVYVQAKDWKKLSGDLSVDKLLFSKNFAQFSDLLQSATNMVRRRRKPGSANSSSASPLLLDITATSEGEDIRVANNLGKAKLGFNLQVTGPTETPLINGFVEASPDSGTFGYLRRNFALDTLRLDWNTSPLLQGKFQLSGSHLVRRNCNEEQKTGAVDSATAFCHLILASRGSLEDPRLSGLTSDCATDPGDDGTVGAFVALATDCYPQANSQNNTKWGNVVRDGGIDIAYGYGMGMVNDILTERLRKSRSDAEWLPDSVMLTDFPVGGSRDQLGLLALYHITPDMDAAGVYRHTFTQSGTTNTNSGTVMSDDYGLSLKYRIPFSWIDEEDVRKRLTNRVFLQLDLNQGIDENSRRSTTYQPSLRYRWEFW